MERRRATVLVGFVAALAVTQIFLEHLVVFLGVTGTVGQRWLQSPYVVIAVPYVLFLLLVGAVFTWALTRD